MDETKDNQRKTCPYCAEDIAYAAKKCKHCSEWLEREELPRKKPRWMLVAILILIGILAFTVIVGGGLPGLTSPSRPSALLTEAQAKEMVEQMEEGEVLQVVPFQYQGEKGVVARVLEHHKKTGTITSTTCRIVVYQSSSPLWRSREVYLEFADPHDVDPMLGIYDIRGDGSSYLVYTSHFSAGNAMGQVDYTAVSLSTGEEYVFSLIDMFQYGVDTDISQNLLVKENREIGFWLSKLAENNPYDMAYSVHRGTLTLPDGSLYEGEVRGGKPFGYGTLTYPANDPRDRKEYFGGFAEGIRTGKGVLTFRDGGQCIAQWRDDAANGYGVFVLPGGGGYEGEWKDGFQHGLGSFRDPDGSYYQGEWKNGLPHGRGTLNFPDGSKYVGEWNNGVRHGYGLYYNPQGTPTYGGQWVNDQPQRSTTVGSPSSSNNFWEGVFRDDIVRMRTEFWSNVYSDAGIDGYHQLDRDSQQAVDFWDGVIDQALDDIFRY